MLALKNIVYYIYFLLPILLLKFNKSYFGVKSTSCIKGFLAVGIIFHHISQLSHDESIFQNIGYYIVGIFFVISGYGLFHQLKNRENYLSGFLGRRLLKIIIPFVVVSFIYIVYRLKFIKETIGEMAIQNIHGTPFIFNGWFVYTIILFYLFFYISFKYIKNETLAILFIFILINAYILCAKFLEFGVWWTYSSFTFILGIILAKHKNKFDKIVSHDRFRLVYIFAVTPILYVAISYNNLYALLHLRSSYAHDLFANINCLIIVFLLIVLITRLQFANSKILKFLGIISFEIYMIHGLFINIYTHIFSDMISMSVVLFVFICTIPSAYVIKLICDRICSLLLRRKNVSINCN